MQRNILFVIILVPVLIGLTACESTRTNIDSYSSQEPATVQPSSTATAPTETVVELPTPSALVPTKTYPPTPKAQLRLDISRSPLANDLLNSEDKACKLPCWYGLQIGVSKMDDAQGVIKNMVGAPQSYVLITGDDPPFFGVNSEYITFDWVGDDVQGRGPQLFSINTQFEPQTDALTDIRVSTTLRSFITHTMPQRVLKELGVPSGIWEVLQPTERSDVASLETDILYDVNGEDIYMSWRFVIPVQIGETVQTGQIGKRTAKWCLNGGTSQDERSFSMKLPATFHPETADPNKIDYRTIEQVFGVTPEELYQRVISEDNTCLSHEF